MRILKKSQLLVVLLAASFFSLGAVEQTRSEKSQLQFTISEESKEWDASWEQPLQIAKPTHVAVFQLENLRHWGGAWFRTIAKVRGKSGRFLARVTFSEEGKKITLTTQPGEFLLREAKADRLGAKFWLYATSEQQAREMAEVFIRYAKSLADVRVRRAEYQLEDSRERITDIENEIPKIEEKKKPVDVELAKIKEKTYYRNRDDAQKSILGWNNLLSAAEVDIIGIEAKLDMINQLREKENQKKAIDHKVLGSLSRMQMAEEIELAGALARKNAAQSYRKKAMDFLDLAEKSDSLSGQLETNQMRLSSYQGKVANIEKKLPQLRADVKPVEVVNNEVKIHPVK